MLKLSAIAFIVSTSAALADPLSCPPGPLASVDVYDGPVSDQAILAPDKSTKTKQTWDVSSVFAEGRAINVICTFGGSAKPQTVASKGKLKSCELVLKAGKPVNFTCK